MALWCWLDTKCQANASKCWLDNTKAAGSLMLAGQLLRLLVCNDVKAAGQYCYKLVGITMLTERAQIISLPAANAKPSNQLSSSPNYLNHWYMCTFCLPNNYQIIS